MHPVPASVRGQANRAYMAEMAVLCQLYPNRVLGWDTVTEARGWYEDWTATPWWAEHVATAMPKTPRLHGAGASEVSRYTPAGHILKITRWDFQLVTLCHELAHAVDACENGYDRADAHRSSWAGWHVRLLQHHDEDAARLLLIAYDHMGVL